MRKFTCVTVRLHAIESMKKSSYLRPKPVPWWCWSSAWWVLSLHWMGGAWPHPGGEASRLCVACLRGEVDGVWMCIYAPDAHVCVGLCMGVWAIVCVYMFVWSVTKVHIGGEVRLRTGVGKYRYVRTWTPHVCWPCHRQPIYRRTGTQHRAWWRRSGGGICEVENGQGLVLCERGACTT